MHAASSALSASSDPAAVLQPDQHRHLAVRHPNLRDIGRLCRWGTAGHRPGRSGLPVPGQPGGRGRAARQPCSAARHGRRRGAALARAAPRALPLALHRRRHAGLAGPVQRGLVRRLQPAAGLRRAAQAQGARYVQAEAVGVDAQASGGVQHIRALRLADGQRLECSAVVTPQAPGRARWRSGWALTCRCLAKGARCSLSPARGAARLPAAHRPSGIWLRPEGGLHRGLRPT